MTEQQNITTIEINGVKMDIDLRQAVVRRHENLKVGDFVKVMSKDYSGHSVKSGVVIGFDAFQKLPTIIVAVLSGGWGSTSISYLYFNEKTTETELIKTAEDDAAFDKSDILSAFDREENRKLVELQELRQRRAFFEKHFGRIAMAEEPAAS